MVVLPGMFPASISVAPNSPNARANARTRPARNDLSQEEPLPDHKVHGEVSVGVGTGGYREVAADVTAPIGDNGEVDVAIDAGSMSGRRR